MCTWLGRALRRRGSRPGTVQWRATPPLQRRCCLLAAQQLPARSGSPLRQAATWCAPPRTQQPASRSSSACGFCASSIPRKVLPSQEGANLLATAVSQEDHPGYKAMIGTPGLKAVNLTFMPVQFDVRTRHSLLLAECLLKQQRILCTCFSQQQCLTLSAGVHQPRLSSSCGAQGPTNREWTLAEFTTRMWGDDNATGGAVWPFAPTLRVKRGEVMRIGLRNNLIRAPGETAERGLRMGSVYKMQDFIALHTHGLHAGASQSRQVVLYLST